MPGREAEVLRHRAAMPGLDAAMLRLLAETPWVGSRVLPVPKIRSSLCSL